MVNSELNALINENSNDTDEVIYTNGSFVRYHNRSWTFIALACCTAVQEASYLLSIFGYHYQHDSEDHGGGKAFL